MNNCLPFHSIPFHGVDPGNEARRQAWDWYQRTESLVHSSYTSPRILSSSLHQYSWRCMMCFMHCLCKGLTTEDFRLLVPDPLKLVHTHNCGHGNGLCTRSLSYSSWELQSTVFVWTIVHSFTARQLRHVNGEGAHYALSHQCACAENLKWILDKQLELLSTPPPVRAWEWDWP